MSKVLSFHISIIYTYTYVCVCVCVCVCVYIYIYIYIYIKSLGVPKWHLWCSYKCRRLKRCIFDPWVQKIPWRRKWQPGPVFLPKEPHGQRSLSDYSPWGHKESDTTET